MRLNEAVNVIKEKIEGKQYGKEIVGLCPYCRSTDKKFYVNVDTGQFSCKKGSCNSKGNATSLFKHLGINDTIEYEDYESPTTKKKESDFKYDSSHIRPISDEDSAIIDYMMSRGISVDTLREAGVEYSTKHNAMVFKTFVSGEVKSVQYRTPDKRLFMERGSSQNLWGTEKLNFKNKTIYITEGVPDCLTLREMAIENAVSMPNGCANHSWIDSDWDLLNKFDRIVLCYDNDMPGKKGLADVRSRLDFATLYELDYGQYKDVNDMFMGDSEALYKTVRTPKEISMDGFVSLQNVTSSKNPTDSYMSCGLVQLDKIFGGFRLNESTLVVASSGAGKAQPLYAKISTPDGWKNMGDIAIGDTINGMNKTTKVTGVFPQGKRPVYEIELMDGRKTRADEEHLWSYTSTGFRDKSYRTGTTLELIDRLNKGRTVILPETDGVEYNEKELPVHPYVVGALIGDGCLTCNGIQISSSEEDVVSKVATLLNSTYRKMGGNNYTWYIYGGKKELKDIGLVQTARNKRIPKQYMFSSKEDRMELLKGLFDTDGSVRSNNRLSISTMSGGLANDIVELCGSLGIKTGVSKDSREKYKDDGICYLITLQTSKIVFSSNKHTARYDFNHKKKYDNGYTYVRSITYIGEEECQCISVDSEDKLYITDDFIVTHNTTTIANMLKGMISLGEKVAIWSGELSNATLKTWVYSAIAGEKAIEKFPNPFREGDYITTIKRDYEERIDRAVDGKLFVYDGNKSDAFAMLKHFEQLHKRYGVKHFFIDNASILDMTVKGVGKYEGEEKFSQRLAEFTRNNAVHIFIIMHPTKTTLNADPNYIDKSGKVKKPERFDQYQVRGSASIVNLAHNILFLVRASEHDKAWYVQSITNALTRANETSSIPAKTKMIVENLSMIAYLVKNRGGGYIYEDVLFGYDAVTRRIYGLSSKDEDLSREVLKDEDNVSDDVIEITDCEFSDF